MSFNFAEIIDFFKLVDEMTNTYITCVELKPMKVKDDIYITGFKRKGIGEIYVHLKEIKQINIKAEGYSMALPLREDADAEMWVKGDILSDDTIRGAFNDIRNHFFQLKSFVIANLSYRHKTNSTSDYVMTEESIIYENKTQACKETIKKRKKYTMFKTKFINWGDGDSTSDTSSMTDEEFAAAAMA